MASELEKQWFSLADMRLVNQNQEGHVSKSQFLILYFSVWNHLNTDPLCKKKVDYLQVASRITFIVKVLLSIVKGIMTMIEVSQFSRGLQTTCIRIFLFLWKCYV